MITLGQAVENYKKAREDIHSSLVADLSNLIELASMKGLRATQITGLSFESKTSAEDVLRAAGFDFLSTEDGRDHDWSIKVSW